MLCMVGTTVLIADPLFLTAASPGGDENFGGHDFVVYIRVLTPVYMTWCTLMACGFYVYHNIFSLTSFTK
jgi:hypothetical protein